MALKPSQLNQGHVIGRKDVHYTARINSAIGSACKDSVSGLDGYMCCRHDVALVIHNKTAAGGDGLLVIFVLLSMGSVAVDTVSVT